MTIWGGHAIDADLTVKGSGGEIVIPLRAKAGAHADPGVASEFTLPYLESVQVTVSRGGVAQMSATLSIPYMEALRFVDTSIFDMHNVLSFSIGYPTMGPQWKTRRFRGVILSPPEVNIGVPLWNVTFKAMGIGGSLLTGSASGEVYENQTNRQILFDLSFKNNVRIVFRTSTKEQETRLDTKREQYVVRDPSIWGTFDSIADTCGLHVRPGVEDGEEVIVFYGEEEKITRSFTLVSRGQLGDIKALAKGFLSDEAMDGFGPDDWPLTEANIESSWVWWSSTARKLLLHDMDPNDAQELAEEVYSEGDTGAEGSSSRAGPTDPPSDYHKRIASFNARGGVTAKHEAEAIRKDGVESAIKVTGTTLGDPQLDVGGTFNFNAIGERYGRIPFEVMTLTHSASAQDWTTSFEGQSVKFGDFLKTHYPPPKNPAPKANSATISSRTIYDAQEELSDTLGRSR